MFKLSHGLSAAPPQHMHAAGSLATGLGAAPIFLCAVLGLGYSHPASAETVKGGLPAGHNAVAAARAFVEARLGEFGVEQATLTYTTSTPVPRGEVLRFGQQAGELPVLNGGVSVLIVNNRIALATGKLYPVAALAAAPRLRKADAVAIAEKNKPTTIVTSAKLFVMGSQRPGHPVWRVTTITRTPLGNWKLLIDAVSGKVLMGLSTLRHEDDPSLHSATGYAYVPNPVVGDLEKVVLSRLTDASSLTGIHATVNRCGSENEVLDCSPLAKPSQGDATTYDYRPEEGSIEDAFAEVHTYYHVDTFSHWLNERFGFTRPDGRPIKVFVNFHYIQGDQAYGMANAFYGDITGDNRGDLVFGQSRRDFSYDGDVIYHEYVHSVIDQTSRLEPNFDDLGLNGVPAALNEAFADLLSSAFTGDPQVGEYAGGAYGGMAIRDLSAPPLSCPQDLSGQSHRDGEIWGRLMWRIRRGAEDKKAFDDLLYTTMVTLHRNSGFADATEVFETVIATEQDPALMAIAERELRQANMGKACGRIVDLVSVKVHQGFLLGLAAVRGLKYFPGGLQYKVDVPENAKSMSISIATMSGRSRQSTVGAFIRKGATISFAGGPEVERDVDQNPDTDTMTFDKDSDPPLVPGKTYYVLPWNTAQDDVGYRIAATFKYQSAEVSPSDAGIPETSDSRVSADLGVADGDAGQSSKKSSGCAIVAASPDANSLGGNWLPVALLIGLAFMGRRRQRKGRA